MYKLKASNTFIAFLLLLFGCSQVIDLDVDQVGGELVVFGRISNSTEGNFVKITRTQASGELPLPVSGATVTLFDDQGNTEPLVERSPGEYTLSGNGLRKGTIGHQYHVEINVDGQAYFTAPQQIPELLGKDSITWEQAVLEEISDTGTATETDVVNIFVETEIDNLPEEFYFRWDLEEAYTFLGTFLPLNHFPLSGGQIQCYVETDLNEQNIFLHNGKTNRATFISPQLLVSRPVDLSFQTLHYFNVIRSVINEETHEYWRRLDQIVNRQGSIFDVAPAGVPGNVLSNNDDGRVLGFFEVVAVDTTRLRMTRNDIPLFIFDPCEKVGQAFLELFTVPRDCRQCLVDEKIIPEFCAYCRGLPGITYTRPSYFN